MSRLELIAERLEPVHELGLSAMRSWTSVLRSVHRLLFLLVLGDPARERRLAVLDGVFHGGELILQPRRFSKICDRAFSRSVCRERRTVMSRSIFSWVKVV